MQINKKTFEKFIKDHSFYYLPSQSKLSYPKLERILKRMMNDKELPPIKIANGKIIEGHHRYLCGIPQKRNCIRQRWRKSYSSN